MAGFIRLEHLRRGSDTVNSAFIHKLAYKKACVFSGESPISKLKIQLIEEIVE